MQCLFALNNNADLWEHPWYAFVPSKSRVYVCFYQDINILVCFYAFMPSNLYAFKAKIPLNLIFYVWRNLWKAQSQEECLEINVFIVYKFSNASTGP